LDEPEYSTMNPRAVVPIVTSLIALACSPALDWREVRPEGSGAITLFPCKPSSHARMVMLAGGSVRLTLSACTAAGATFGFAFADVVDPRRVGPALAELTNSAASNLSGRAEPPRPADVSGMTPNPGAVRVRLSGRRPDGEPIEEEIAVFSKGTRIYQATVLGPKLDAEATRMFFGALRLN
jgi:hypothetical protein